MIKMNLEQLQEKVGLLENDSGIVTQAILDTDLESLLSPYLETTDYQLYFNYANRIVIGKYAKDGEPNISLLKKSIYYALKGNEYNLRTLIETTNFDYDPISNYEVHETITSSNTANDSIKYGATTNTTTSSISRFDVKIINDMGQESENRTIEVAERQHTESTSYGALTKTLEHDTAHTTGSQNNTKTDSITYGAQAETHTTNTQLGDTSENRTLTSEKGERISSTNEENKVSAYNVNTYQPSSTQTTGNTQNKATDIDTEVTTVKEHTNTENGNVSKEEHTDTHNITETLGERVDKITGSDTESLTEHSDTKTFKSNPYDDTETITKQEHTDTVNRTESPHSKTSKSNSAEHDDTKEHSDNGTRERNLKGRYGFTTVQSMIEAERNIANLNIAERLIAIIIHQICEGVLYYI